MADIYVILTQSGSLTSKLLRKITKDEFTHSSLAFDPSLNEMYSFARRYRSIPFYAGFVKESKDTGMLKKYKSSNIQIIKLQIDTEKLQELQNTIKDMYIARKSYKYSFKGVLAAYFGKEYKREKYYYCSEFVKKMLVDSNVVDKSALPPVTKPIDFQKLENKEVVYAGPLDEYELY